MKMLHSTMSEPTEAHIIRSLINFLRGEGYRVRLEVPNMGQSADLVATRSRWVTFVEAKRRDWRRAMEQCRAHESVADFICIALSLRKLSDAFLGEVRACGYGVIQYDAETLTCQWVVEPTRNGRVWGPQRRRVAMAMRAIEYAD